MTGFDCGVEIGVDDCCCCRKEEEGEDIGEEGVMACCHGCCFVGVELVIVIVFDCVLCICVFSKIGWIWDFWDFWKGSTLQQRKDITYIGISYRSVLKGLRKLLNEGVMV